MWAASAPGLERICEGTCDGCSTTSALYRRDGEQPGSGLYCVECVRDAESAAVQEIIDAEIDELRRQMAARTARGAVVADAISPDKEPF
jgi:hypothetical protein